MLKNLGEALEGLLARHLAVYRTHQTEESRATSLETAQPRQPPKVSPKAAALSQAKREERLAGYQHVVTLRKLGFSQTAIANQVGRGHATVSRWLNSDAFPEQQPRQHRMELDSHLPFLRERWEAGCHTIAQLHRELVAAGYPLSYRLVHKQLARSLPEGRKNPNKLPLSSTPSCACTTRWFSCFFAVLPKNFPLKNRKRLLCFDLCTLRWIRHIHWFSSSRICCEHAPEKSSTTGFHQPEPARSASCRGLF